MTGATATRSKKKGLFSRFKKKKGKTTEPSKSPETIAPTPPPSPEPQQEEPRQSSKSKKSVTKKGIPVVTGDNPDDFNPSDVRKTLPGKPAKTSKSMSKSKKKKRGPRPNSVVLDKAPTARASAFSGPPRYDWIDVETAAAVKVQAAYRRNKVMDDLAAQGVSTAAMRNRARRRQAQRDLQMSEDTPGIFQCCGVGLAFGDGTEEDFETTRLREKQEYEEKKRVQAEYEETMRKLAYKYKNKKPSKSMVEAVEVVEDSDDED